MSALFGYRPQRSARSQFTVSPRSSPDYPDVRQEDQEQRLAVHLHREDPPTDKGLGMLREGKFPCDRTRGNWYA
jgi:hypothetical protein